MILNRKFSLVALALVSALSVSGSTALNKFWSEKSPAELKGLSVDAEALNRPFVAIADTMKPSVVNIYTKTRIGGGRRSPYGGGGPDDLFRFFFGNPFGGGDMGGLPQQREAQALGSGFVINGEGIIVTNSHVVRMSGRNADSIMVKFVGDSPRSPGEAATVLGVDEITDVAVIKLKKKRGDLKIAPLGDSGKLKVGEWVVAIGNPYGHTNSVTKGIVSALGRSVEELDHADFIQTDASINPGNSGGPLFNLTGEVIGINTAVDARAQGIGFAIPINTAKGIIRQIIETGGVTVGWIGVGLADLRPEVAQALGLKNGEGAFLQEVMPGGPAAKAGLRASDAIVELDGKKISSAHDLASTVRGIAVGSTVPLKFVRDGKVVADKRITIEKRQSETAVAQQSVPRNRNAVSRKAGLYLGELTAEERARIQVDPSIQGVLVKGVLGDGLAAFAGLRVDDVIKKINRQPCPNLRTAEKLLAIKGDKFLLEIQRKTASAIILLDLAADQEGNPEE